MAKATRRRMAPAAERNKAAIADVLKAVLPDRGLVLEIASGTGQHIVHFAREMPGLDWQPSDLDADARGSISAWITSEGLPNLHPPLDIDVCRLPWPVARADALVCINMIHIAPWAATEALMRGAASVLATGCPLYLYGPYRRGGTHTAPSNAEFDDYLRHSNPAWGVRDLETVVATAERAGFAHADTVQMPANNLSLIFRRR